MRSTKKMDIRLRVKITASSARRLKRDDPSDMGGQDANGIMRPRSKRPYPLLPARELHVVVDNEVEPIQLSAEELELAFTAIARWGF